MNRSRISSRIGTIDAAAAQKTRCIHNRARVKGCDRPFSVQKVQRDERSFIAHSAHGQELFQVSSMFTEGFVVSDFVTSDAVLPVAIVSLLTYVVNP